MGILIMATDMAMFGSVLGDLNFGLNPARFTDNGDDDDTDDSCLFHYSNHVLYTHRMSRFMQIKRSILRSPLIYRFNANFTILSHMLISFRNALDASD
jgi:hypothetical protein